MYLSPPEVKVMILTWLFSKSLANIYSISLLAIRRLLWFSCYRDNCLIPGSGIKRENKSFIYRILCKKYVLFVLSSSRFHLFWAAPLFFDFLLSTSYILWKAYFFFHLILFPLSSLCHEQENFNYALLLLRNRVIILQALFKVVK